MVNPIMKFNQDCRLPTFPPPCMGPPTGAWCGGGNCRTLLAAEELRRGASHARRAAHWAVVRALEAIVVDGLS